MERGAAARTEQARTRRARRAVVAAATGLFVAHGYAGTSIAQIAAAAGVPEPTVYRLYGTKLEILSACMDVAIAGDDAPEPVAARPVVRQALNAASPTARLRAFVAVMVDINARISRLYWVVFQAAGSDPAAAQLLASLEAQRDRGQGQLVESWVAHGDLAAGVTPAEARDLLHALMSPETYRLLVLERDWSPSRYADWLTRSLAAQLLP